jgi:hypothetical protein
MREGASPCHAHHQAPGNQLGGNAFHSFHLHLSLGLSTRSAAPAWGPRSQTVQRLPKGQLPASTSRACMKAVPMRLRAITNSVLTGIAGNSDVGPGFGWRTAPACACRRTKSGDSSKVEGRMRAQRPCMAWGAVRPGADGKRQRMRSRSGDSRDRRTSARSQRDRHCSSR